MDDDVVVLKLAIARVASTYRAYGETVIVRAVQSDDGMTAEWAKLPYDVLDRIGTRIANEVSKVALLESTTSAFRSPSARGTK